MSHSAYVLARKSASSWRGDELDIHDVEDLDELADLMRDFGDGALTLVFIEEDDEYVAIARLEGDEEPRGFVSDARCLDGKTVASTIFDGALELPVAKDLDGDDENEGDEDDEDEEEEDESEAPEIEPAGEAGLLTDLGVSESQLLALCAAEGNLPADVINAVCERLGCAEELERIRGL